MLQDMYDIIQKFAQQLVQVLPLSPFLAFRQSWDPPQGLSWLNWFFPVGQCVQLLTAWVGAYALYLLYRIVLRWIKAVT